MLTMLTSALVNTLVQYMFEQTMNKIDSVNIDSAPSWYMEKVDNKMCTFSSEQGSISIINSVKNDSAFKMQSAITNVVDVSIYDNMKNIKTSKERQMTDKWKVDPNLNTFVSKNINFEKIKYNDELNRVFVRACIPKETIINYQKNRLENINKSLLNYKADSAMSELDELLENDK